MNDTDSITRDVVIGYDTASDYEAAGENYTFGGIQGRYPSNQANYTYQVMPGSTVYTTPFNENSTTLHGRSAAWSYSNWTIVSQTTTSVTFSLVDGDSSSGFPGQTITYITHTLTPKQYHIRIIGLSTTQYTPLMPISRTYWNLDAVADPTTPTVLNQTLRLPYSGQRVQVDNATRMPTGLIEENPLYSIFDFWHASKSLGRNLTSRHAINSCGPNCTGYDATFLISRDAGLGRYDWTQAAVATLQSRFSGIRMSLFTDQAALHVDTCNAFDGSIALKADQGLVERSVRPAAVQKHGCVALAPGDWPAGVLHPGWGRQERQQFGPQDPPYVWQAIYSFATSSKTTVCATSTGTASVSTVVVTVTATTAPAIFRG